MFSPFFCSSLLEESSKEWVRERGREKARDFEENQGENIRFELRYVNLLTIFVSNSSLSWNQKEIRNFELGFWVVWCLELNAWNWTLISSSLFDLSSFLWLIHETNPRWFMKTRFVGRLFMIYVFWTSLCNVWIWERNESMNLLLMQDWYV